MHAAYVDDDPLAQRMVVFGRLEVQFELLVASMCVSQIERITVRQQGQLRGVNERFVLFVRSDLATLTGRQLLTLGQLIHLILETFFCVLIVHTLSTAGCCTCTYVTEWVVREKGKVFNLKNFFELRSKQKKMMRGNEVIGSIGGGFEAPGKGEGFNLKKEKQVWSPKFGL